MYSSKRAVARSEEMKIWVRRPQLITDYVLHVQVNDIPQSEVNPAERKSAHDTCATLRDCTMLTDAKPIPNLGEGCTLILLKAGEPDAFSPADRNTGGR